MNPYGEIIILAIVAAAFTLLGYMGGKYEISKEFCSEKGGIFVQSSNGWLCMKGEKL